MASNGSFVEGFQQLSLNMDCVIEEEQKEYSSNPASSNANKSLSKSNSMAKENS